MPMRSNGATISTSLTVQRHSAMLDFPNSPTVGQVFDSWMWDGIKWASGAGAVGYMPLNPSPVTATGSTASRALQDRFAEVVNVKDYGAKGDGTTYDTAAVQAAANAIPAGGGVLYIPAGTYLTNGTVILKSNTMVCGDGPGSVLLGGASWNAPGAFFINQNHTVTTLTDSNIEVRDLLLDYGTATNTGAGHCVDMVYVRIVKIVSVIMQCRGAGNAIALLGCNDTLVDGCSAYGFSNCAYDHWTAPQNARVVNCYAETTTSQQMINFNPENTANNNTGAVADGFVLANNQFVSTGANAIPMQLEPLGAGTSVRNVVVSSNTFRNVLLSMRGDTRGATVSDNAFISVAGGNNVFACYAQNGGTPDTITFIGNIVTDPATTGGNYAAIYLLGTNSAVVGNVVSGSNPYACSYTAATVAVVGNSFPSTSYQALGSYITSTHGIDGVAIGQKTPEPGAFTTLSATGAVSGAGFTNLLASPPAIGGTTAAAGNFTTLGVSGALSAAGGLNFGSQVVATTIDLSKHIALYSTSWGFNLTTNQINVVTNAGSAGFFDPSGLNIPIGHTTPTAGTFTTAQANSGFIVGAAGPTITSGSAAPAATQPVGSLYLRTGGAVGATLYVSRGGGTWAAVAGV